MKRDRNLERRRYAPTYRIAKAVATLALDLATPPCRVSFARARETIESLAAATSERSFARYVRALQEVFDGAARPALEIDRESSELRLVARSRQREAPVAPRELDASDRAASTT